MVITSLACCSRIVEPMEFYIPFATVQPLAAVAAAAPAVEPTPPTIDGLLARLPLEARDTPVRRMGDMVSLVDVARRFKALGKCSAILRRYLTTYGGAARTTRQAPQGGGRACVMGGVEAVTEFVIYAFNQRQRSVTEADRAAIQAVLQCDPSVLHLKLVQERDTLEALRRATRCIASVREFVCGPYRIDLYYPDAHLAVECQEHGHANYSVEEEQRRYAFLEAQLHCRFVCYNPDAADFSVLDVVNEVVGHLGSAAFLAWKAQVTRGPWAVEVPSGPTMPKF